MATTSPLQGVPLPDAGDADNVPYDLANAVDAIEKRLVMVFADATTRDSTVSTPEEGMVAYLQNVKVFTKYQGGGWHEEGYFPASAAGDVPLIVKGAASQSGNLQEWRGSDGSVYARIDAYGGFAVKANASQGVDASANTHLNAGATAQKALVVRGQSGQTANLQEWQDSAGSVVNAVTPKGYMKYPYRTDWSVGWPGVTGTTQYARVTRIGGLVVAVARIQVTSTSGSIGITLPYGAAGGGGDTIIGNALYKNGASVGQFTVNAPWGTTEAYLYPGGGGGGELYSPAWTAGYISVNLHYFTDDATP